MKKLFIVTMAVLLLVSLPLIGCKNLIKGSGEIKTEEFTFSDFTHVEVDGPFEVNIAYADSFQVSITANENLFEKIEVAKQDKTLQVELQSAKWLGIQRAQYVDTTVRLEITMPHPRGLLLSGAAKGTFSNFNSRASVDFYVSGASILEIKNTSIGDANFDVSGASEVTGGITAGDVMFKIGGASTAQLDGSASNIVGNVGGASQLKLDNFTIDNADMRLSGASKSTVNLNGKLDVNLKGASDLSYFGEPVMGDTSISGGSTMSRK